VNPAPSGSAGTNGADCGGFSFSGSTVSGTDGQPGGPGNPGGNGNGFISNGFTATTWGNGAAHVLPRTPRLIHRMHLVRPTEILEVYEQPMNHPKSMYSNALHRDCRFRTVSPFR
jgi:hypothetical protein